MGLSARETITTWANGKAMRWQHLPTEYGLIFLRMHMLIWFSSDKRNYCTIHVQVNKTWCPTTSWNRDSALIECYTEHLTLQVVSSTSADDTVSLMEQQQAWLQSKKQRILRHTAGYTNVKKKLRHPVEWAARFQHLGAYSRNREGHDDRNQGKTGKCTHWLQGKEQNLFWCPVDSERLKNAFNPPVKCNDKMRAD